MTLDVCRPERIACDNIVLFVQQQNNVKEKKMLLHPILLKRKSYGIFFTLFKDLKKNENKVF